MNDIVERLNSQCQEFALFPWTDENRPMAERFRSLLADSSAEIVRLRAIVDKLPKTADGKVPSPPCELWEVRRMGGMYVERHTCLGWVYDPKYRKFVVCPNMQEIPVSNLYSTREEAEAARAAK